MPARSFLPAGFVRLLTLTAMPALPAGAVYPSPAQTLPGGIGFTSVITFGPEDPDPALALLPSLAHSELRRRRAVTGA